MYHLINGVVIVKQSIIELYFRLRKLVEFLGQTGEFEMIHLHPIESNLTDKV